MKSHFRSQVRLSCDGKLTRNRANSNFHPQSAIVILAPIWTKWWYNHIFVDAIRDVVSMVSSRRSSVSMVQFVAVYFRAAHVQIRSKVLEVSIAEVVDFCSVDGEVGINGAKMTSLITTEGGSEAFFRTCLL